MSGSSARLQAISALSEASNIEPKFDFIGNAAQDLFGSNVFSLREMQARLPKAAYLSVKQTMESGEGLDPSVADVVAAAMKDWAIDKGATHFTHVFYPLTGLTAEKHDSFLVPDSEGRAVTEFSGKMLIQGEPDASSFPSGGIRQTFEARGYTAWDVTSPAFILENPNGTTLAIPTAFVSWTGEALDKKTPVLRSNQAMDRQARRILELFGHSDIARISMTAGCEQEYFLVDRKFANARPDLMLAGRTLFGAPPAKGQEFDDHYFGAISERVQGFMMEVDRELYKLGIPARTRHNEVAPGQFELAPLHESANIASDHQQMIMITLRKVAERNGLTCLLHEKPFRGINGSGKHLNFSFGNSTQGNLLDPGKTPHDNAQFLVFCAAVVRAVHLYGPLLRSVVATAGNDHRLGANEAPPAILSVFLGDQLSDVFAQITNGGAASSKSQQHLHIGVDTLPPLPMDAGDRNRTSPFAFTGSRFEFRAVGSNQSVAGPITALNVIIADSLDYMATELEKATADGNGELNAAVQELLKSVLTEHGAVVFNGDNYTEDWQREAEKRGLANLRTTVDALPPITDEGVISMFENHAVLSRRELASREEVYLEQYVNSIAVEANLTLKMGRTQIFPAAIRYQSELARACADLKALGTIFDTDTLDTITQLVKRLQDNLAALQKVVDACPEHNLHAEARYSCNQILPAMLMVREEADDLEARVADDLWPLPSYQEMLFIR